MRSLCTLHQVSNSTCARHDLCSLLTYDNVALAAVLFFRAVAGFGFPLFSPYMYAALGYGKGDTILAAFAIVVGCPAYVVLRMLPHG